MSRKILLSLTEGRVVRDLFHNQLFELLDEVDISVLVATPSANVPSFVENWTRQNVSFCLLKAHKWTPLHQRLYSIRKRLIRYAPGWVDKWMCIEDSLLANDKLVLGLFTQHEVRLAVLTHPMFHWEYPVYLAARQMRVPTLGILRSWDNLYQGLRIRPDSLAVWNSINYEEAQRFTAYSPDRLKILGSTQFDLYFKDNLSTRDDFVHSIGLNPEYPIITLATIGQLSPNLDETYMMDLLIEAIQNGTLQGSPQIICRLHPASKLEQFLKYEKYPFCKISYVRDYIPGMGWSMSPDEVIEVKNILYHSAVVVSPGSTITLEASIFDTPTVVPTFHGYLPEELSFTYHLNNHYKRLISEDLVPFAANSKELFEYVNKAIREPDWYSSQRKRMVQDYVHYTDGRSVERLRDLIIDMIGKS